VTTTRWCWWTLLHQLAQADKLTLARQLVQEIATRIAS
jgi:predicted DNA-binding ribbon-helix-helix protein